MKYVVNEGGFELPDGLTDRSVNMLMSSDGVSVSYVVTRDRLQEAEDLQQFIQRQFKELSRQVSKFKELARAEALFGQGRQGKTGVQIQSTFKQHGNEVHQRQAVVLLDDGTQVLIVTATALRKFTAAEEAGWTHMLTSYEPAAPRS